MLQQTSGLGRERAGLLLIVAALVICAGSAALAQDDAPRDPAAYALEQRLHAPCCRHLLLDAHESETASVMRREIRDRMRAGETTAAIEADFVQRYGASIVAIPANRDPRGGLSAVIAITLMLAAAGIVVLGVIWVRRTKRSSTSAAATSQAPSDELDAQLDDELRRLDT
jgi:cytochrome c-type biogenesis protein CcmH